MPKSDRNQQELDSPVSADMELQEVSYDVLRSFRDLKQLYKFAVEVSGIPCKVVADRMHFDEKQLCRCFSDNPSDNRHFPGELLDLFMDAIGNEIPLRGLAVRRGYGLYRLKTRVEMENEQLKERVAELEMELRVIQKHFGGKE